MPVFFGGRLEMPRAARRFSDAGRLASMGKGGTCFRPRAWRAGVLCVVLAAGCRASGAPDEGRPFEAGVDGEVRSSLVEGHRFGRWLEVDLEPAARDALEHACILERNGASEE